MRASHGANVGRAAGNGQRATGNGQRDRGQRATGSGQRGPGEVFTLDSTHDTHVVARCPLPVARLPNGAPPLNRSHPRHRDGRRHHHRRVDLRSAVGGHGRDAVGRRRPARVWLVGWRADAVRRARSCAELSSAFPRTGGVYVFLREAFSPAVGFLWGWAMFWTMHTGIIAAIAMVFARYVGSSSFRSTTRTARRRDRRRSSCSRPSTTSACGTASVVQTTFTVVEGRRDRSSIVAGVAFIGRRPSAGGRRGAAAHGRARSRASSLAIVAGLFAFGGWHMVTYAAEETVDPERTIPRALLIGTLIVTALLHRAQRGVLPRAAADDVARVDARRRRCRRRACSAAAARQSCRRSSSSRRSARSTASSSPDRASISRWRRTACCSRGSARCTRVRHAASRDRAPGRLGGRAGRDGHLSRAVHARRLHRVDLLRADGGGAYAPAPARDYMPARIAFWGYPVVPMRLHRRVARDIVIKADPVRTR